MAQITYRIEKINRWSYNESLLVNIQEEDVVRIAAMYGFPKDRVVELMAKDKYNGQHNPSCDAGWVRLTKMFS